MDDDDDDSLQKEWEENGEFREQWKKDIKKYYDSDDISVAFAQYLSGLLTQVKSILSTIHPKNLNYYTLTCAAHVKM